MLRMPSAANAIEKRETLCEWRSSQPLFLLLTMLLLFSSANPVSAEDPLPRFVSREGNAALQLAPMIPRWDIRAGDPAAIMGGIDAATGMHRLTLKPAGAAVELVSPPLKLDEVIPADEPWHFEVQLRNGGIEAGRFSLAVLCVAADGKVLRTLTLASLSANNPAGAMRRTVAQFGPNTPRPYPAGTAALQVQLLFAATAEGCLGEVELQQVLLKPALVPGNPAWPREFVVNVGDLQTRFESRSFWTPYRIEFRGQRLGVDRFGSHYGTTINFPGTGFIGSGHTENADEQVQSVTLRVDGASVAIPASEITAQQIVLSKQARIRDLQLQTVVTLENNQLREAVTLQAMQPTPVNLAYHFMHPWAPTAKFYLGELLDGTEVHGEFIGDRKHRIAQPTRWSALFDETLGTGAVTYVVAAPQQPGHWQTNYWDIDDVYRKHYFVTFQNQTIPVGQEFHYEIITAPFTAKKGTWAVEARQLAKKLASQTASRQKPETATPGAGEN